MTSRTPSRDPEDDVEGGRLRRWLRLGAVVAVIVVLVVVAMVAASGGGHTPPVTH